MPVRTATFTITYPLPVVGETMTRGLPATPFFYRTRGTVPTRQRFRTTLRREPLWAISFSYATTLIVTFDFHDVAAHSCAAGLRYTFCWTLYVLRLRLTPPHLRCCWSLFPHTCPSAHFTVAAAHGLFHLPAGLDANGPPHVHQHYTRYSYRHTTPPPGDLR